MSKDYEIGQEIRTWSTYVPEEAGNIVQEVLRSGWLNTGKMERLFRAKLCEKFNIRYVSACTNGTAALRASLAALGVGPGDEVVSTPFTFIATNTAILEQGARPIFADIDYDTLNIDPESIRQNISSKTKAIICVHYGGNACDMDAIRAIGREYNIPIIEDAAHALGSKYKDEYIGSRGDIITFSFQVVKIVTSGDGGAIATPKEELYEEIRKRVWYGVDRDKKETKLVDPLPEDIDVLGFKYNMNDITAALACVGLDHFDEPFQYRSEIGQRYREELAGLSKVKLTRYPEENTPNYQIFPIHVEKRLDFAMFMKEHAIQVNVNNRRNDRYTIFGGLRNLSETARADEDVILLPIHADLRHEQVDRIIECVRRYDAI